MSVPEEIAWMPATEVAAKVKAGELSPVAIAETMIERITKINADVNCFVSFDPERIRRDAQRLEAAVAAGEQLGPLHGVPFSVKELTAVKGDAFTAALKPWAGQVADRDAILYTRMIEAGGLYLGKTATPEAGYAPRTDSHLYGPTHNPWKLGYSAGGSSGGAAAAVAAGLGPLAEGSDGGGSIRIPAAMCGTVGFKPSLGRIPETLLPGRFITWAFTGPITRTVSDAALMMNVVQGADSEDPLSLPHDGVDYLEAIEGDLTGMRIAYTPDHGLGAVDPEVAEIVRQAVSAFEELGATVVEATPPWPEQMEEAFWDGIWVSGFAAEYDLLDWRAARGELDDELIELVLAAENLTGVQQGRADLVRAQAWDAYREFMTDFDVVVSPTLCSATYPITQFAPDGMNELPLRQRVLGWLLTYPFNFTTTPAASVPAGWTADGRPVGLQIAGGFHADATVLRAARNFERARPWAHLTPDIAKLG